MISTICASDGCDRKVKAKGLCHRHYLRLRPPCTFDGCGRPRRAHGLCTGHESQRRRTGTLRPIVDRLATAEIADELDWLIRMGESPWQAAARFGMTPTQVRHRLWRRGTSGVAPELRVRLLEVFTVEVAA